MNANSAVEMAGQRAETPFGAIPASWTLDKKCCLTLVLATLQMKGIVGLCRLFIIYKYVLPGKRGNCKAVYKKKLMLAVKVIRWIASNYSIVRVTAWGNTLSTYFLFNLKHFTKCYLSCGTLLCNPLTKVHDKINVQLTQEWSLNQGYFAFLCVSQSFHSKLLVGIDWLCRAIESHV